MTRALARHLTTIPIFLIGLGSIAMGLAWILVPEPWLLDQAANEILLQTSYETLLALPGNEALDDYLVGLYAFFGLWVFAMGLLVAAYVLATGLQSKRHRGVIYAALSIILTMAYWLQFTFIPTTPFLWVSHGFLLSLVVSFIASRRL